MAPRPKLPRLPRSLQGERFVGHFEPQLRDDGLQAALRRRDRDRPARLRVVGVRLTPDKHLSIVLPGSKQQLGGLAVHKDGRIFAARTGEGFRNGSVVAMQPDGSGLRTVFGRTGVTVLWSGET
jgi:hypothetical protein